MTVKKEHWHWSALNETPFFRTSQTFFDTYSHSGRGLSPPSPRRRLKFRNITWIWNITWYSEISPDLLSSKILTDEGANSRLSIHEWPIFMGSFYKRPLQIKYMRYLKICKVQLDYTHQLCYKIYVTFLFK